jgi:alginate O-acetyltransferase complex protein AlgI
MVCTDGTPAGIPGHTPNELEVLFDSWPFAKFFAVSWAIYWLIARPSWRKSWLLLAGIAFYANWSALLAQVLCISTTCDYWVVRRMVAHPDPAHRRFLMRLSVVMNLGLLFVFKYFDFCGHTLQGFAQTFGVTVPFFFLNLPNPVGISFYTFEAISYSVDCYQGKLKAERRLDHLLLFITFFPHVVAGPIVRAADFLPQIWRKKQFHWRRLEIGLSLFLLGLFKKSAIADRLSLLVDPVFQAPEQYSTPAIWAAVLGYSLQIYCDFSGYSDMAIGLAHTFGFRLSINFDRPYAARNISVFWRRWHISLSQWLRDYLYIPLGGNANGAARTSFNLWMTMLLGGLWHGASWNFVLWGALHGAFLTVHRFWRLQLPYALSWLLTFAAVTLAWIPFRAATSWQAWTILQRCFWFCPGKLAPAPLNLGLAVLLVGAGTYLSGRSDWPRRYWQLPFGVRGAALAGLFALALVLGPKKVTPFIYFQF